MIVPTEINTSHILVTKYLQKNPTYKETSKIKTKALLLFSFFFAYSVWCNQLYFKKSKRFCMQAFNLKRGKYENLPYMWRHVNSKEKT